MSSYGEMRGSTPLPAVSLVVQPDEVREQIELSCEQSAVAAVEAMERFTQRLSTLLTPLEATVRLVHFAGSREAGKLASAPTSTARLLLVMPLRESQTAWQRAARVAQLEDSVKATQAEAKKLKPAIDVRRDAPVFVVADPQRHRLALIARHQQQVRMLGPHVKVSGLRPDAAVVQHPRGLEEVELTLPLEGSAELMVE